MAILPDMPRHLATDQTNADGRPTGNRALKVLVVDPRPEARLRVVRALTQRGRVVIGAADGPKDALELFKENEPGMVLIAANLPGGDGTELAAQLLRAAPELGIFMYDEEGGVEALETMLEAACPPEDATPATARRSRGALSPRERQVLQLLADGFTGTEIAALLTLSRETVQTHLRNAMRKLGARTRTRATIAALAAGEIQIRAQAVSTPRPVARLV